MNKSNSHKVYKPNSRSQIGLISTWVILSKNIIEYRELIFQLFKRDFLMSYRKSFLGMSWLFFSPLLGIVSWVFMNSTGILAPGDVGIPYPAYVLLSTSIFGLFMNFYQGGAGTLQAGQGFILQVSFPHDILLFKQLLQQLANFGVTFAITLIVLAFFGVYPSWYALLFPILTLPMMLLGGGIGLLVSVISIVAADLSKITTFFMGLLMFVTPVIYSANVENEFLQSVIKWNPLTYLISTVRDAILYGTFDQFNAFLIASSCSIVFFLFAWRMFFIAEQKVIEKMI